MRRYFCTGATGFIGREIVRQLLEREDTGLIGCLTRGTRDDYIWDSKIQHFIGDITNFDFAQLEKWRATDVIHGANEVNDLLQPDQLRYYYTIVEGTNRVLKWAATTGIERTLVLSSGAVARDTLYGRAKRQCEMLARSYGGNTKIARIFSVLGPEMPLNGQYAVGRFVGMALSEQRVRYYGGDSMRTYLDVSDCAKFLLQMLDSAGPLPMDVAGKEHITMRGLASLVARVFEVPCVKIEGPDRADAYLPDSSVEQTLTLTQSLELIRDYYKALPDLRHSDLESAA